METEDFVAEDDLRGMDPSVVSLVLESDKIYEHGTKANADRMSPWLERVSDRTESRTKCGSRRLSQPKDNRSVTPRRLSRPSFQAREYEIDFRHHPDTGRYMEEYRNAKLQKQEANLRTAVLKSERRRASEPVVNCSQPTRQLREKPAQEQTSADEVGQKSKPLIVISSRGSSRPCSLPLEGHFQGRKLQGRSQVLPRTTYVHRESLWHQSGGCTSTTQIIQLECPSNSASSNAQESGSTSGAEKHPFSVSTMQRQHCTSTKSTKSNHGTAMARQSSPVTLNTTVSAAIDKCDSWVKSRDQDLNIARSNDGSVRGCSPCGSLAQVSSRASSSKGHQYLTRSEVASGNSSQSPSPKPCSDIDYSHYTDMFKNVLEYYGPKRLRPRSNISLDQQMVSLKS